MPKQKKELTPQQQGARFEAEVSKKLHELVEAGKLMSSHKMVNAVGTPYDYQVLGEVYSYALECKALRESKANKAFSLRLSCLTDNEWSGMQAWIKSPYRKAWVIWKSMLLNGDVFYYAVPFSSLDLARSNGVKHLDVASPFVTVLGEAGCWGLWKLFAKYEVDVK